MRGGGDLDDEFTEEQKSRGAEKGAGDLQTSCQRLLRNRLTFDASALDGGTS